MTPRVDRSYAWVVYAWSGNDLRPAWFPTKSEAIRHATQQLQVAWVDEVNIRHGATGRLLVSLRPGVECPECGGTGEWFGRDRFGLDAIRECSGCAGTGGSA